MTAEYGWLLDAAALDRSWRELAEAGAALERAGDLRLAASAYDLAFGKAPHEARVAAVRRRLLDALSLTERGLTFRYVPAGPFVMGNDEGEDDERPAHVVELGGFWMLDAPVTWAAYCRLLDWEPPPKAVPRGWDYNATPDEAERARMREVYEDRKIRWHYCNDRSRWPHEEWEAGDAGAAAGAEGEGDDDEARHYDARPMVALGWEEAAALGDAMSAGGVRYRLPTEAEWEKAARGGLTGCLYPWGDAPPTTTRCDFGRYDRATILDPRSFPPNGYGLHAMAGTVWEWTLDWYDALHYAESARRDPAGPRSGRRKVLRGGSWADCEEACTVSFRMALRPVPTAEEPWGEHHCPNVGFRLARVETDG